MTFFGSSLVRGSGFQEPFESPETTWRLVESDCRPFQLAKHERQFEGAHGGRGCEYLQAVAGQGTYAYLAHDIQPVRVIRELAPSVWVKSNRHGLQLMARVVLPRSLENGKPITSFLFGDRYEATDAWRQLRIDDILTKLHREVVALRTQKGPQLDEREAYIDLLVLNVYTGPGPSSLWIDDLQLDGSAPVKVAENVPALAPAAETPVGTVSPTTSSPPEIGAKLDGNVLVADGRPLMVRAIESQGETFAFLQSLGFNTVILTAPPVTGQIAEAERCGVWLIAPPGVTAVGPSGGDAPRHRSRVAEPPGHTDYPGHTSNLTPEDAAPSLNRILAWHLGERMTSREWPGVVSHMDAVSRRDASPGRIFLANLAHGWSSCRHDSVVLLFERPVLNSSFELQDFIPWLETAGRQVRGRAPFWVVLPTEPDLALQGQVDRLAAMATPFGSLEPDQIRWLAFASVAAGARGLYFRSRTRLDGQDATTRLRAATLSQVNRELELVAPWVSGGTAAGEQDTNNPRVRVFALETERARLLILLRRAAEQQFVVAPTDPQQIHLNLHHALRTDQTYSISAGGVDLLPSQHSGTLRIAFEGADVVALVLLTSDPLAVNYAGRTSAAIRRETAGARLDSTLRLLEETETIERILQTRGQTPGRSRQLLMEARAQLRQAENLQQGGDSKGSLAASAVAANSLRQVRRARWQQTVQAFTSPCASPLCVAYATLPGHFMLASQLSSSSWSGDVLAGGEMEHLEHLLNSGWKQQRADLAGVSTDVQLSLDQPRGGRSALHLRAWQSDSAPAVLDGEPPVTISSPPIAVQSGQLVRVRGWVRTPQRFTGSWDGVMIYDSHSGPQLAERIAETQGWREFTMYRVATATGDWRLIFALSGLGEAWIDDVSVTVLTGPLFTAARH